MVGDREHDIIGVKENKIDSIAVTSRYGSVEELKAVISTYIVHSVEGLVELLEEV